MYPARTRHTPLRELVSPDQRHIGRFLCQRHRIAAAVSEKGKKKERKKNMESRRKICTHEPTDRHSIQPTCDGAAVLHRQAARRSGKQAGKLPASLPD